MLLAQRMRMAASGSAAGADVIGFEDTFTGTNGTNLTAHTPDSGGTWVADTGTITIEGNTAVVGAATADYTIDTYYAAGRITASVRCGGANANFAPSISFRGTEAGRYMLAYFSGDGSGVLYRRSTGVAFTVLDTFTCPSDTNWHAVEITYFENAIEIFIDSVSVCTFTSTGADYYGTRIGLRGFQFGGDEDAFDALTLHVPPGMEVAAYPAGRVSSVFTDDFGDANGTQLSTTGWTETLGDWTTESGHAENATEAGAVTGYLAVVDAGSANFAAKVAITTPATDDIIAGIVFRLQDGTHFIEAEINNRPTYDGPAGFGVWYYDNGGVFHPVMTKFLNPANATTYTMRVWTNGDYVFAEVVEAGLIMAGKCSMFASATKVGLFEARDSASGLGEANHFDNFEVSN